MRRRCSRGDGPRGARRRRRLDRRVELRPPDANGASQHEGTLRPRRQRLVRTGHQRVSPGLEGVWWQPGVEPEVGPPGGVDDERDAVSVGHLRERADVADGAHVRRLADEDTLGVRGGREGLLKRGGRHPERQAVGRVDLWAHPDRLQAGKHEAEQHRAVQGARDDDPVSRTPDRERERLVAVGRPADGEAAQVGPPQVRGLGFGLPDDTSRELHRVEAGVQGDVTGDDVPDEVVALLVPRDREGGRGGLLEAQPRVEQGRVAAQASGIGGHGPQSAPVPRADRPHHRASTIWPRSRPIE